MSKAIKYSINKEIINSYIESINNEINNRKRGMKRASLSYKNESAKQINEVISHYKKHNSGNLNVLYRNIIKQIAQNNNGYISGEFLNKLRISRQYLTDLVKDGVLEKVNRGVYILSDYINDDYYSLQSKYRKIVFSHMNALYFHDLTEEIPYIKTVTVPNTYHCDYINDNCKVFYSKPDHYKLGLINFKTNLGNRIKIYDIERCICDIIIHQNMLDFEQVKKAVRNYVKSKNKNYAKLSRYAEELNSSDKIMRFVGMYEE